MPGPTAVLDTDVLVPIIACDFLLTAFDHGLYEPIVSTATLAEIERTLIDDFPHLDPAAIHHRVATMHVALEDQLVDGQAVDMPAGINPKNSHVVGAALVAAAQVIVSNDRRLRGEVDASGLQLAARPRHLCDRTLALVTDRRARRHRHHGLETATTPDLDRRTD